MACVKCNNKISQLISLKDLKDDSFVLVYAKTSTTYIGEYDYGYREKGEAFYMLTSDVTKAVSKTPIVIKESVEVTNETVTE